MTTALPPAVNFTGGTVTEAQLKTALTNLHDYLAGLLGTDGLPATAFAALAALATKAVMQTGTDNTLMVTAARVNDHDGVAKASISFTSAAAVNWSDGIASLVHTSTGIYTISFSTPFTSGTAYAAIATTENLPIAAYISSRLAGSIVIGTYNTISGAAADAAVNVAFYGRQ